MDPDPQVDGFQDPDLDPKLLIMDPSQLHNVEPKSHPHNVEPK